MKLPGRLSATTLGDLLGMLHRGHATGVLELVPARGEPHRIHLISGMVEHVESPLGPPPLGELLERMGLLRRGATERAMAAGHGRDTLIGQRLVESKLASPPIVAAVLRRQSRERIEALFSLSDADIRFRVARPMHAARIKPLPLLASDFLHGRPRKRDPEMSAKVTRCARRAQLRELLGVSAHADPVALRRAFRTRAAALHPDRYPHASDAERAQLGERFAELSAAYHGLNENG